MINEGITKTLFDAYNFLEFLRNDFLRNSSRRSPAALTLEDATIPTHRGINLVDWCTLEPGSRILLQTPLFQEVKKVEKWERNSMVERERKKETRYLGVARENALSYTIPQPCNVAFTFQSFSINSRATVFDTRTSHFRETEQPSKLDVSFSSLSLSSYFSSCFERQAPRYRYQCLKRARKREWERGRKSLCSDQRNTEGVECERSRYVEY